MAVSHDGGERTAWRERQRRRRVVARTHERIRWRRGDFAHQASRRLVKQFAVLAVEDVSVRPLVAHHPLAHHALAHHALAHHALAKSMHDAAWTQFAALLRSKAEWAGRACVA